MSKPCRLPSKNLKVFRILRYPSERRRRLSLEIRISSEVSLETTQSRKMSAPDSFMTSKGEMTLPKDLDIFLPSPSTINPWVRTARYGALPQMPQETRSEL